MKLFLKSFDVYLQMAFHVAIIILGILGILVENAFAAFMLYGLFFLGVLQGISYLVHFVWLVSQKVAIPRMRIFYFLLAGSSFVMFALTEKFYVMMLIAFAAGIFYTYICASELREMKKMQQS